MIHNLDVYAGFGPLSYLLNPRYRTIVLLMILAAIMPSSDCLLAVEQAESDSQSGSAHKKPLDHESYNRWHSIGNQSISNDGRWAMYVLKTGDPEADSSLKIRSLESEQRFDAVRGFDARFTSDSRFVVYLIKPDSEAVKKAEEAKKKKPEDQPKNSLGILDLKSGVKVTIERVKSFALPEEGANRLAYLLEAKPTDNKKATEEPSTQERFKSQKEKTGEEPEKKIETEEKKQDSEEDDKDRKKTGTDLVLRDLSSVDEERFTNVVEYRFNRPGSMLAYTVSAEDSDKNGVRLIQTKRGRRKVLAWGKG